MTLKGEPARYGVLAATLHWLSALAITTMLPLGFIAAHVSDPRQATALLRLHLPLGLLVLGLTLARIAWLSIDRRPGRLPDQPLWQHQLARGNHLILYALIILLCVSGIGLVALTHAVPAIFAHDEGRLPDFAMQPPMVAHAASAVGLICLLALHLIAAGYHQFYRHDRVLARMYVGKRKGGA